MGYGGVDVDDCRVEGVPPSVPQPSFNSPTGRTYGMKTGEGRNGEMSHAAGRFPANLIHDGSPEVVGLFPSPHGAGKARTGSDNPRGSKANMFGVEHDTGSMHRFGDSGSAARFFYAVTGVRE